MTYSIFDTGNLVVSYDREEDALVALARLAAETPDADERLHLVAFDELGQIPFEPARNG